MNVMAKIINMNKWVILWYKTNLKNLDNSVRKSLNFSTNNNDYSKFKINKK